MVSREQAGLVMGEGKGKDAGTGSSSQRSGKIHRNRTFPMALNRLRAEMKDNWKNDLGRQLKQFRDSARSLVTLNIVPNTCKVCPHKYSCAQNAFYKGLFRSFAAGFIFKAMLNFLSAALSGKLGRKGRTLADIFWSQDSLRFGQFIGVMSFLFKAVLCTLRRLTKRNDPKFHAIAGFVSGIAVLLDNPSRRGNIALYCIIRALSDLYMNLKACNQIRSIPHGNIIAFSLAQVPIIYSFTKCPELLEKGYHRWIMKMGNITAEDLRATVRSRISDNMHRLPEEAWEPCQYHKHHISCMKYNAEDWVLGLGRAARIYLPVHVLPTLMFSPHKILQDPGNFAKTRIKNIIRSALFLTSYQTTVKAMHCTIRSVIKDDPSLTSIVAGLVSGLSLLVEHPRRRSELTLYVLPRALETSFNYIRKFHSRRNGRLAKAMPIVATVSFQMSIALWMYIQAVPEWDRLNHLNKNALKAVFGSRH